MDAVQHEILPEGESTAKWAIRQPGFAGSVRQLLDCARCGGNVPGGPSTPQRFRDLGKPTLHVLCEECYQALPD